MKVNNFAVDTAVKIFTSTAVLDIEEQINAWYKSDPDAFIKGMELTSFCDPTHNRFNFTVIVAYQSSE